MGRKLIIVILALQILFSAANAKASTEADCAIWLCLPAGFTTGCSAAYGAFMERIKRGRAPLPELSSCTTGPRREQVTGNYQLGHEIFEVCNEGYVLKESRENNFLISKCVLAQCALGRFEDWGALACPSYDAVRRSKPSYVKMWVGSDYLGQFWY